MLVWEITRPKISQREKEIRGKTKTIVKKFKKNSLTRVEKKNLRVY